MSHYLFIVLALCLLAAATSIPIVICRNGGNSGRRRRQVQQWKQQRNTCEMIRLVNPVIKLGECPIVSNTYTRLYTKDQVSFLDDYYRGQCDIVTIREKSAINCLICGMIGTAFMLLFSTLCCMCVVIILVKTYERFKLLFIYPI